MAGAAQKALHSNEPQVPLHWDKNPFQGDDDHVLDEDILSSASFDMSALAHSQRRQSFATDPSLSSPVQHAWPDYGFNTSAPSNYALSTAPNIFPEYSGPQNPHPDVSQYANFGDRMGPWHTQNNLGQQPTTTDFNNFSQDIDNIKSEAPYHAAVAPSQQTHMYGGLPAQMNSEFPQYSAQAMSPYSSASSTDAVEKIPRSGHTQSPTSNQTLPHLRNGVRKKNARVDIPEGHNIHSIDQIINNTNPNDEEAIKKLKSEKRLLRNRQAALDSRCRKKHHTEKLEEEKKHFLAIIDTHDENMQHMQQTVQKQQQDMQAMQAMLQQWHQFAEGMEREKEELIRRHTLETAELRKKNTYLAEEMQRVESMSMSAQPSSSGVSAGFPEFEHLTMDGSPLNDFSFFGDPPADIESKSEQALTLHAKKESPTPTNSEDKTATNGLLLMLLLCGAWIASHSSSSAPAAIPQMPEDVRAASAMVLDNIYEEAGLHPTQASISSAQGVTGPQASSIHRPMRPAYSASPLASLHNDITRPTEQQQREQLFSLSTDQYIQITSDDLLDEHPDAIQPPRRRNLGEALAAMRTERKGSVAEHYTKSLLMNEVPVDVVRQFRRMVESSGAVSDQRNGNPLS